MKTYSFVSREIREHVSGTFAWKLYKLLRMSETSSSEDVDTELVKIVTKLFVLVFM